MPDPGCPDLIEAPPPARTKRHTLGQWKDDPDHFRRRPKPSPEERTIYRMLKKRDLPTSWAPLLVSRGLRPRSHSFQRILGELEDLTKREQTISADLKATRERLKAERKEATAKAREELREVQSEIHELLGNPTRRGRPRKKRNENEKHPCNTDAPALRTVRETAGEFQAERSEPVLHALPQAPPAAP